VKGFVRWAPFHFRIGAGAVPFRRPTYAGGKL